MVHDNDLEMAVFHTQMKPMPKYEVQIPLNKVPHIFYSKRYQNYVNSQYLPELK